MQHSPSKCKICGEYHCLAGCVPIEQCYSKKKGDRTQNGEPAKTKELCPVCGAHRGNWEEMLNEIHRCPYK